MVSMSRLSLNTYDWSLFDVNRALSMILIANISGGAEGAASSAALGVPEAEVVVEVDVDVDVDVDLLLGLLSTAPPCPLGR